VDPGRRRELTRYGAPAAFLAAATVAVLLIKAGLNSSDSTATTASAPTTVAHTAPPPPTTTITLTQSVATTTTTPANAQYYVIEAGDTLGAIAAKYNTSVDELLTLNPGLDPNALHPGDRIRVG
jgi:LysM repeat protein